MLVATMVIVVTPSFAQDKAPATLAADYQRPQVIPFPASNPYSAEKAQLGKMLFFDQRLSRNFNMSCATCHNPSLGWEDGVPGAFGGQGKTLDRHSPTILNLAWGEEFFWDGRAPSLEEQIKGPIQSPNEMNIPIAQVVDRLQAVQGYRNLFSRVFPNEGISEQSILKSIATYERTIVSGTAPFDRWIDGDSAAISDAAKRGFALFNDEAGCNRCHTGWNFTDNRFHDIGLATPDNGRMTITQQPSDQHAFKTPGLRNISQRAPYMHNGSLKTLSQVIDHYISGGIQRDSLSPKMTPIPLTPQQKNDLLAFLGSLTGEAQAVSLPILPY
ncbi:tryptophan tryptophylquinone biosynthesis enzyme MauG [Motiliproteus coralliicola]|uniref:Methylamine utilization protein MauG n=2 Tax=Motiliproteus coralliicola TaxID=2283196 RepID=A0A369WDJ9_9GAMM|nr:tryptophan tryptophylquinone biosynthesis enzyme MauG [Motiliproteus coralliicola]